MMAPTVPELLTSLVSRGLRQNCAKTVIPPGQNPGIYTFELSNVERQLATLATYVDEISDWDIPDNRAALELDVTVLPSTTPYFVVQYRTPVSSVRKFGDTLLPERECHHVATTIETGMMKLCPHGPLGLVVVRLKPETAAFLLGEAMYEFADTKVDLGDIFRASDVASLAEKLSESQSSSERIVDVLQFLWTRVRRQEPDLVLRRAVAHLRKNPSLRVGLLADELGVSVRHLTRKFTRMFGTGPKRFARIARVEQVLATCRGGSAWSDIAFSCGFSDQAHLIKDFHAIVGTTPAQFFRSTLAPM